MKILACCLACFTLAACAQPNPCASLQSEVEAGVARLPIANDQLGVFRTIGDQSLDGTRKCPQSARLWYLAARSAEVLESPMNGQAFAAEGGLKNIVAGALSHAPNSAPVLTVAARVQASSSLARKAMDLDPRYEPARRALAELLAKSGALDEALRLTDKPASDSMRLTRARVLLAAKRPSDAAAEIRRIPPTADADELSPSVEMRRDTQEVLGFALLDLHQTAQGEQALRAAAGAGSLAAQRYLSGKKP